MSATPDIGELRELVHKPPSAATWIALMGQLEGVDDAWLQDHGLARYLDHHLGEWPDTLRRAEKRWFAANPDDPRLALCRSVHLEAVAISAYNGSLTHQTIAETWPELAANVSAATTPRGSALARYHHAPVTLSVAGRPWQVHRTLRMYNQGIYVWNWNEPELLFGADVIALMHSPTLATSVGYNTTLERTLLKHLGDLGEVLVVVGFDPAEWSSINWSADGVAEWGDEHHNGSRLLSQAREVLGDRAHLLTNYRRRLVCDEAWPLALERLIAGRPFATGLLALDDDAAP